MRIELLEKIEGEASIEYRFEGGKISDLFIRFPHFRGIERIVEGRDPLDALVINPRVCGICGHAHLIATAKALEDAYGITPTQKAKKIRNITRYTEIIQNHLKWFYFTIFSKMEIDFDMQRVHRFIVLINRLSAIFSAQWPHSSYALPGGVTCDPTYVELLQAQNILSECQELKRNLLGERIEELQKDIQRFFQKSKEMDLLFVGQGLDRFIAFSDEALCKPQKILNGRRREVKVASIEEQMQQKSFAKEALYKGKYYETGPLARGMIRGDRFVKALHRKYKDSFVTRVLARIYEVEFLLEFIQKELESLDLAQESFIKQESKSEASGIASVEAPRGSLIHKVEIKEGKIASYTIITPTQWNLANGTFQNLSSIKKAIVGMRDTKRADLIFRSFDICSVCTTH